MGTGTPTKVSISREEAIKVIQNLILSNKAMEDILNLIGDIEYQYCVKYDHDEFCIKAYQFE